MDDFEKNIMRVNVPDSHGDVYLPGYFSFIDCYGIRAKLLNHAFNHSINMNDEKLKALNTLSAKIKSLKSDIEIVNTHGELDKLFFSTNTVGGLKSGEVQNIHILDMGIVKQYLLYVLNKELSVLEKEYSAL